MLKNLSSLILNKLRLSNPWNYKAPFLISVPYLLIGLGLVTVEKSFVGIGCSFLTIFGIAGFGYLSNDFMDREADLAAGKKNALLSLKGWQIGALLVFFLALAILPWIFFFPITWVTGGLLVAEFLLFILYAAPPFRLKERGFWGALTDSLYAHAVPAVLAAYTFAELGTTDYANLIWLLALLGGWQLCVGLRNILFHQLKDFENDTLSGTHTWVTKMGKEKAWKWIQFFFLPLEILLFLGLGGLLIPHIPYFIVAYPVFLVYTVVRLRWIVNQPIPKDLRQIVYAFLDDYYVEWIPIVILTYLSFESPWFLILAGVHCLIFKNGIKRGIKETWKRVTGR